MVRIIRMVAAAREVPFALQERLRFIEATLLWEGTTTRNRVSDVFGVTPNHVSRDIAVYLNHYPDSLEYRIRQRAYVPGPRFAPVYASQDPAEYLGLLQTRAETGTSAVVPLLGGAGVDVGALPSPALGIDAEVLKEVLRAIGRGSGLGMTYYSLAAKQPVTSTIWPHALIHTGARWHARALDKASGTFREFALARMERPRRVDEPAPVPVASDDGWTTHVYAEVVPHPKFNEHQKSIAVREFGMKRERGGSWVWKPKLRRCLVGYFARRYRLDDKPPVNPRSHWIVLRNREALQPFFLPVGEE